MAKLYFRYGAMNSGKSTALMQVAHNYEEQGMQVLILKPQVDTKGGGELVSRLGVHRKADRLIRPDMDVFEVVREASQATKLACVLCDEPVLYCRAGRAAVHGHRRPEHPGDLLRPAGRLFAAGLPRLHPPAGAGPHHRRDENHLHLRRKVDLCNCRKVNGQFVFEGEQVAIDLENDVQYVSMCPQCYFRARRAFYAGRK